MTIKTTTDIRRGEIQLTRRDSKMLAALEKGIVLGIGRERLRRIKEAAVANTVLRSFVNGTQLALEMSGVSPIASSVTLAQEAVKELDTQRQEVTQSITIEAETGLRIYIPQRTEY